MESIRILSPVEFRELFLQGMKEIPDEVDQFYGKDGSIYAGRVCGKTNDDNWEITHAGLEVIRGHWIA